MTERLARRSLQLFGGLFLYGIGLAMLVRSDLGAAPWDVLTLGLSLHVPLSFGTVMVVISAVVLLCWIPLKERPGIATALNVLLVGPSADIGLYFFPDSTELWARVLYLAAGIVTVGATTGVYIGARYGTGPRDGLMTGLDRITPLPLWAVRTGIEVTVVALGWLLGGTFGVGTVLFALLIGPLCQYFIPRFQVPLAGDHR